MIAILVVVGLMLAFSFFCSISEAALYAVPPSWVETLRVQKTSFGLRLGLLRDNMERPISAILFVNTMANTMGAALAGALVGNYFHENVVLSFSLILTVVVLLFGEIVPKTLGVGYSRSLAPALAWPVQLMVWSLYPLVLIGEWVAKAISPSHGKDGPREEEIIALARLGARSGTILKKEEGWVSNVLHLNEKRAAEMMTPRTVLTTLRGSLTVGEIESRIPSLLHSRIPVTTDKGADEITGIVLRRWLVEALIKGRKEKRVEELARPALFVSGDILGHHLIELLVSKRSHIAVVVDEFGGTMGVVTLEDVIEEMLGVEIVDESDPYPDMRAYAETLAVEQAKGRKREE